MNGRFTPAFRETRNSHRAHLKEDREWSRHEGETLKVEHQVTVLAEGSGTPMVRWATAWNRAGAIDFRWPEFSASISRTYPR